MLRKAAAGGGNLLLNVGPAPDGSVPPEAVERLTAVGKWIETYGEALYGLVDRADVHLTLSMLTGSWTLKGTTAYYWCSRWPGSELAIGGLDTKVRRASLLATGQVLKFDQTETRLVLKGLPVQNPDKIAGVSIIKLEFDEIPHQELGEAYVKIPGWPDWDKIYHPG